MAMKPTTDPIMNERYRWWCFACRRAVHRNAFRYDTQHCFRHDFHIDCPVPG